MKTLCKHCKHCKTLTYERINRNGELISFKYCKGNKTLVEKYNFTISNIKNRINILISSGNKQGRIITSLFKENNKNDVKFLNKNRCDCRLKNLQERPRSCTAQEGKFETSIFPGVVKVKSGKFHSLIKIGKKRILLGVYDDELNAFHHYILKCDEIGRKVNKTTKAYKEYVKDFDVTKFEKSDVSNYNKKYKNIHYRKDSDKYVVLFSKNGKNVFRKQVDSLDEALVVRDNYLKKSS